MSFRLVAAVASFALVLAGCITPNAADVDAASAATGDLLALAPDAFQFVDPQNAPHPAFNWPTIISTGDVAAGFPSWWAPIEAAALPEQITGIAQLAGTPEGVTTGAGISLFGSLAIVPGFGPTSWILDISDPKAPKVLSELEPVQGGHRGSAVIAYPDGKLAAVFSTGPGFETWDITDPTMPVAASQTEPTTNGHKLGVVPGTPYVYNANSNGGGLQAEEGTGITEIYDLTDPYNPRHVQDFPNGFGCHHIYFWNSVEKQRTVCAGIEFAQIWDTADPENPVVIVSVPIPHGAAGTPSLSAFPVVTPFAHFSILNDDGTILIVGDELGGGAVPPGCTAGANTPVVDNGAPTGALWFYDVSDETDPQLLGWYSPGHHLDPASGNKLLGPEIPAGASCTAHHGRLVPQEDGRDLLAMSFYGAGVVLLDFTDARLPQVVDQVKGGGHNVWETWYYNGYLFTGDLNRGFEVLTFE